MKKFLALVFAFCILPSIIAFAAGPHATHVFWTPPTDATSNTVYTVYASTGTCPATGIPSGATAIATNVKDAFYDDSNVVVGQTKCYYVVAITNSVPSLPSNTAPATTPSLPATGCGATAQ